MEYYAIDGRVYALCHEGRKGMHWYQRLYQNEDGSFTPLGYIHYGYTKRMAGSVAKAVGDLRAKAKAAGTSAKNVFKRDLNGAQPMKGMTVEEWNKQYGKDLRWDPSVAGQANRAIAAAKAKQAIKDVTKGFDKAKGEAAQPTEASRAHTAKALAQLDAYRAMHAKAVKEKADAAKAYKESMKKAIKQAKKDAKRDAKRDAQDEKWLGKNGEKILKRVRKDKTIQKELKAYEKELRNRLNMPKGSESAKLNNALNQREATLLNKYVSIKSPNGTAVTFVAMRRDRGVVAAIGDSSRFRNGVYANGTAAYTKDKAKQI